MNEKQRMLGCMAAICMMMNTLPAAIGEETNGKAQETPEEAGFAEIQGILDAQPVGDIEGMNLEMLTTTLTESAMGEYYDPVSGFRMQYPSILQFSEKEKGVTASSDDGKIRMEIESTPDGKQLTVQTLMNAVRMEDVSAEIREYTDPACFVKETEADGEHRIDIYMLTGDWLHHVRLTYPEEDTASVYPFVSYMIHSMTSDDGNQG